MYRPHGSVSTTPRFPQYLHVVGEVRLLGTRLLHEVGGAEGLAGEEGHDLEPERVGQNPDQISVD